MGGDRGAQVLGAALATAWLLVVVAVDVATPPATFVVAVLSAVAPLIACAVLSARATAVFAVVAVALTVASGWWNHTWGSAQQTVRIIDVTVVSAAAVVIATVRVRREQRYARVVVIAEVAQRAILPTLPKEVGQVAVGARYLSAARDAVVGGDLYDCYHSGAHVRFLVGDVRGKGIAAVEQAARVIRAFRQAAATRRTLPEVAADMSAYLEPFFDDEEFVTGFFVDTTAPGRLTLVSCGHPPPMLVSRDGRATLLEAPAGLPLGLGEEYDSRTVTWAAGDRLLMYTDGLSEARDTQGRFLPLPSLAPRLTAETIDDALDGVLEAVRRHVPRGHLTDDLAVILLENVGADQPQAGPRPGQRTEGADAPTPLW